MALDADGLDVLLPILARWFRATYEEPTPPQRQGWPSIAAGRPTLIFAPTGSGKTLAAFLACLDYLWRIPDRSRGVRGLYVAPLKALNQVISRTPDEPLQGLSAQAGSEVVGIVLSATQRQLDEVARDLGGLQAVGGPKGRTRFQAGPVTVIDTGQRKELDLQVIAPLGRSSPPAQGSIWPAIEGRLLEL